MRYLADRVYVAENEVAAKFLACGEQPLEIEARADAKFTSLRSKGGFGNGLAGKISGEAAVVESDDGQATAIYGDAVRDG